MTLIIQIILLRKRGKKLMLNSFTNISIEHNIRCHKERVITKLS